MDCCQLFFWQPNSLLAVGMQEPMAYILSPIFLAAKSVKLAAIFCKLSTLAKTLSIVCFSTCKLNNATGHTFTVHSRRPQLPTGPHPASPSAGQMPTAPLSRSSSRCNPRYGCSPPPPTPPTMITTTMHKVGRYLNLPAARSRVRQGAGVLHPSHPLPPWAAGATTTQTGSPTAC